MTDRAHEVEDELTEDLEPTDEEAEQVKGGRRHEHRDAKLACHVKIP